MRRALQALVRHTTAPLLLVHVPAWTGLETDAVAIRRRVEEVNRAETAARPARPRALVMHRQSRLGAAAI